MKLSIKIQSTIVHHAIALQSQSNVINHSLSSVRQKRCKVVLRCLRNKPLNENYWRALAYRVKSFKLLFNFIALINVRDIHKHNRPKISIKIAQDKRRYIENNNKSIGIAVRSHPESWVCCRFLLLFSSPDSSPSHSTIRWTTPTNADSAENWLARRSKEKKRKRID